MKLIKRTLCLMLVALSFTNILLAQINVGDTIKLKSNMQLKNEIKLNNLSLYSSKTANYSIAKFSVKMLPSGCLFIVKSKSKEIIELEPLDFNDYSIKRIKRRNERFRFLEDNKLDFSLYAKLYNDRVFKVDANNFELLVEKVENKDIKKLPSRISIGVVTLPFKYRPQDHTSFDTEFNINTTVNVRLISKVNTHFYGQLGVGFGSVNLNSTNSDLIEDNVQDKQTLSFLSGLMLQYDRIQIGVYFGVDKINNQGTVNWVSNGNMWIGFGAGYNLFKNKVSEESSNNK